MGIVDEDIQVEGANLPDVGVPNALIVEDPGARKRPRFPRALPKQHDLDPAEIHVEILFKVRAFGHSIDEKKYLVRSAEMLRHDERALFATPEGPHVLIVDADLEGYVRIPFDPIGCHASRSMRWRIRRRRLPVKELSAVVFRCHAGLSFLILRYLELKIVGDPNVAGGLILAYTLARAVSPGHHRGDPGARL